MKNFIISCLLLSSFFTLPTLAQKPSKKVFISQVINHPALNATNKGIIDALRAQGYEPGENLIIRSESAQANQALASQIASKFINQKPDLVVGLGTISAQSFANAARKNKIKMVFSSVTDPLESGLVKNLNKPGNNTSGVSNFIDLEPQIKLFQTLQPELKRLGILYNPAELNSVSIVKKLEVLAPKLNITLLKQTANKTADIPQAATKLANRVEAIFISNDNTALSALQSVILAANKRKIPVYVSDTDAVKMGALAALGPNQYEIGFQTGKMIARILQGEDLNSIPVEFPKKSDLYINETEANFLGITIPVNIKAQAAQIIKKGQL